MMRKIVLMKNDSHDKDNKDYKNENYNANTF